MNKLIADLFVRSINKQISRGFLLKICVRAKLIRVLIDQKVVVQIWLWQCIGRSNCPNVDLRQIKATAKPDADLFYMESPNSIKTYKLPIFLLISLLILHYTYCIASHYTHCIAFHSVCCITCTTVFSPFLPLVAFKNCIKLLQYMQQVA